MQHTVVVLPAESYYNHGLITEAIHLFIFDLECSCPFSELSYVDAYKTYD